MFSDDLNHTYLVTPGPASLYLRINNVAALKAQGLPDGWGFGAQATVHGTRCAAYACWGLICGMQWNDAAARGWVCGAACCQQPLARPQAPPALRPLWALRCCRPSFLMHSHLPPH